MIIYLLLCITTGYIAKKIGQFAMSRTCEKLLGFVNSYVYYACQTREIYQVLPYTVDFKASTE